MGPVSSSQRFKSDIENTSIDSEKVYQLRPVDFTWNADTSQEGMPDFGFIAEEVNEHLPELVPKGAAGEPMSVSYDKLSVLLLMELKKMKETNDALERRIQALEKWPHPPGRA
jgi:hypothetical protein